MREVEQKQFFQYRTETAVRLKIRDYSKTEARTVL